MIGDIEMLRCKICDNSTQNIFSAKILNKHEAMYFLCSNCGFLQVENPYWLEEAYSQPINITDTGIIDRNCHLSKLTSTMLYYFFDRNGKYLDYAGGYGIFTRLMRDKGFDFSWSDLYTTNLFARGFEYKDTDNIELITSFESFEHFVYPIEEIEKMLKISQSVLFTTELLPTPLPKPGDWYYYGLEHGQHISFYTYKTLQYIADKYNLNFYSNHHYFHLLTTKQINSKVFSLLQKYHKNYFICKPIRKNMKSRTHDDLDYLITVQRESPE